MFYLVLFWENTVITACFFREHSNSSFWVNNWEKKLKITENCKKYTKNKLMNVFKISKYQNLNFRAKFEFSTKAWIFDQNLNFWPKFEFFTQILIFYQSLNFWPKFEFLTKVWIFHSNFNFSPKFEFLTIIVHQNLDFFRHNLYFWPKFQLLIKISVF